MRRSPLALAALLVLTALAQIAPIQCRIHVALVDKDLNLKAVPRLSLTVRGIAPPREPVILKTGFDGLAQIDLPPGRYRLSSSGPTEFQGKRYLWDTEITVSDKENLIELSNDNAQISEVAAQPPARVTDELTTQFKRLQNCVLTVWSEFGTGTGFIVDAQGLILTNQHVIGPSNYIAVQFDPERKVRAVLLAADPQKDIAVLLANLSGIPQATPAPLLTPDSNEPGVVEGEKVFTIGSPLTQRKILTTGIVSKVEPRAIISDINVNPGNSGGPLFNSLGRVVGLTTFAQQAHLGPGISGIVRIEEANAVIVEARNNMTRLMNKPEPAFLLVEPTDAFPVEAIKSALAAETFQTKPYSLSVGGFDVTVITPILKYFFDNRAELLAAKQKQKRSKRSKEAVQGTFRPLEGLKNWAEYVGEYKPILMVRATPKLRETTGSILARSLVPTGIYTPARMHFKTDFYKMKLFCGEKEVAPIHPAKIANVIDYRGAFVRATDAAYEGLYVYPYDAIAPACGNVTLHLYSEKNPDRPDVKTFDPKSVERVWSDFEAYRKLRVSGKP